MNVYGFDGTIYGKDSTVDFYLWRLQKHPAVPTRLPRQSRGILRRAAGAIDTKQMKEAFFSFLPLLARTGALVASFWAEHTAGIRPPIATRMDPKSGLIRRQNCKGEEEVCRFRERFPNERIGKFYSDSLSDAPLAALAEEAFLVKKNALCSWPVQASGRMRIQ